MDRILLYASKSKSLSITIEAYFDSENNLVFEGYDIGEVVLEMWGDSDYEYSTTINFSDIGKVYKAFDVFPETREKLLQEIRSRFFTESCYSEIQNFLSSHRIPFKSFSWN